MGNRRHPRTWGSGSPGEEAAMLSRNSSVVLAEVREGGGGAAWNWQKCCVGIHNAEHPGQSPNTRSGGGS